MLLILLPMLSQYFPFPMLSWLLPMNAVASNVTDAVTNAVANAVTNAIADIFADIVTDALTVWHVHS